MATTIWSEPFFSKSASFCVSAAFVAASIMPASSTTRPVSFGSSACARAPASGTSRHRRAAQARTRHGCLSDTRKAEHGGSERQTAAAAGDQPPWLVPKFTFGTSSLSSGAEKFWNGWLLRNHSVAQITDGKVRSVRL